MAKQRHVFECSECGAQSPKWMGQCLECRQWNTLVENALIETTDKKNRFKGFNHAPKVKQLSQLDIDPQLRVSSGIAELDRVLGGGFVSSSVVLLGGDPGIGKSTLTLQSLAIMGRHRSVLYVTGEESMQQIALRAQRLGIGDSDVNLLADNLLERIIETALKSKPEILVLDSVQTLYTEALQSAPGSVAQVRETAARLVQFAKQKGVTVILVGHVTKEGALAGPRVLEHMVDTVLYFEGERNLSFRILRAIKNRFGAANEIGVFAMSDVGLKQVTNPSAMFIKRAQPNAVGSVILASQESSRSLLVEVQSLVDQSQFGSPRRVSVGLDNQRIAMLLAVLNRHAGFDLSDYDVFTNVIGGVKVTEPAADIAVALSILSSFKNQPLDPRLAVYGEIGLTGEIRPVQRGAERYKEVEKLGFGKLLLPRDNKVPKDNKKLQLLAVSTLTEAIDLAFTD